MDDDLRWASATEQARLLADGEVTANELHALAVDAVERVDPRIGAVVGELLDPVGAGVPMLLKDAGQEIAGTPHWCGVAALRDGGSRSSTTTELVRRLTAGGLSIIGRAACPELANGVTTEPPGFPPTRNPWDLDTSTGGSSGGSAAAVAAGIVPLAHGSDATGSLRFPAALCGVATLKPSAGLVPGVPPAGQPPNDAWCDMVLARHVEDLVLGFRLLTGATGLALAADSPLRVGLLDHDPELGLPVDPACAEGVAATGALLADLGHDVEIGWPDALERLWSRAFPAMALISDAVRPDSVRWVAERLGRPVGRGDLTDPVLDAVERAAGRPAEEVVESAATVAAAVDPLHRWWVDHDILVTPTTFSTGWPLGSTPGPAEVGTLVAPFSLSGQPALSLPLHHTAAGGPVGVQLVGRRGADAVLLRLARSLQDAADWTGRRPPTCA